MNLHEYQSKEILASYGVRIQRGFVANNVEEAVEAADKLKELTGSEGWVVKAQVHAGGRGKGGGVKFSPNYDKLKENAQNIIGMRLVTPQTSAEGKLVNSVLVAEDVYYPGETETKEFYVSILLDRALGKNTVVYSTKGGMDIEHVAEVTPHLIHKEVIDPTLGLQGRAKSRKSTVLKAIGATIASQGYYKHGKLLKSYYERNDFTIIDTEQGKYHCWKSAKVIKNISGKKIKYYKVAGLSVAKKKKLVEEHLKQNPQCGILVIDNIVHFLLNYNDPTESAQLNEWLIKIKADYNCHIVNHILF
jgi:hypothetical protein